MTVLPTLDVAGQRRRREAGMDEWGWEQLLLCSERLRSTVPRESTPEEIIAAVRARRAPMSVPPAPACDSERR